MCRSLQNSMEGGLETIGEDQQQFLNIVLFMVLLPTPTSKPLIVDSKNSLFTIEWEGPALTGKVWYWLASQLRLQDPVAER